MKCIVLVGYSNAGKTTVLTQLAKELNFVSTDEEWTFHGTFENKRIGIFVSGDSKSIIRKVFKSLKQQPADYIICCSHTKKCLEEVYYQIVKYEFVSNILDAKKNCLLLYKDRDCIEISQEIKQLDSDRVALLKMMMKHFGD